MSSKKKSKCYAGEVPFIEEVERIDKSAQKIGATPIEDVVTATDLTIKQIRERYHTFTIDSQTYVYFS